MAKLYTLALLLWTFALSFSIATVQAQTFAPLSAPPPECGTNQPDTTEFDNQPWIGNNNYLESFLDSIGYPRPSARIVEGGTRLWVPVKFWVYRTTAGTGGPTLVQIRRMMDNLNRDFGEANNTTMRFYMSCEPTYINDDNNLRPSDARARQLARNNQQNGVINIHMVDRIDGGVNGSYYYSPQVSFQPFKAIFLDPLNYTGDERPTTISHEVGHWLGLVHTHEFNDRGRCRREPIDRSRQWPTVGGPICFRLRVRPGMLFSETNGDALRDTPADHLLDGLNDCDYNLTGFTDLYGDSYLSPPAGSRRPDGFNVMSAGGWRSCRTRFSRLQIAVMLHYIYRGLPSSCLAPLKKSQ